MIYLARSDFLEIKIWSYKTIRRTRDRKPVRGKSFSRINIINILDKGESHTPSWLHIRHTRHPKPYIRWVSSTRRWKTDLRWHKYSYCCRLLLYALFDAWAKRLYVPWEGRGGDGKKRYGRGRKLVSFLSHSISPTIYLCLREWQSNVFALGETQYWTRIWTMSVNRFSSAKYSHSIVGTTLSIHPYPTPQKWFTASISHNILSVFLFLSSISISRSHITK